MELLVQKYLRSGKSLTDLKIEHGVKFYIENGKISLTYDQIEAKESDPLSQQCRGLILREEFFDIVAAPMFRFFNFEQTGVAESIDWNSAKIEEKLDGSLLVVYFDQCMKKWFVATRSRPEANVPVDDSVLTFTDLANIAVNKICNLPDINSFMSRLQNVENKTFCFELTSPVNKIVCHYEDFNLTLLAVRDIQILEEEDPKPYADELGISVVNTYSFTSLIDLVELVRSWNPKDHEGVVVKDSQFRRIKIKSPAYVAYNHMRDSLSTSIRGCMEVILLEKDDDVIPMVPEFIANRIKKLKPSVVELFKVTQKDFDELSHIQDMKVFALAAQKKLWPSCLFALKRGKASNIKDFIKGKKIEETGVSNNILDMILGLCETIDPTLRSI